MFERFTREAREVVEGAVAHAERAGAGTITDEHMLLALLDLRTGRVAGVLTILALDRETVVREMAEARRRGGLSQADEAALAGLGIDVGEVVARIEGTHGEGAMADERGGVGRRLLRLAGHRPFAPTAKDTLAKALRIATGRGDRQIGGEHMLLALAARPGVAQDVLAGQGAGYADVERVLRQAA
ncbi:Clp protease N-terminal domain-containing protein [Streptomyces boninensis]|uniref:Clp protease N-terminal domain-containing protein n=1 Tax=Streptomyces boninensis TaxID=2039455 RepID=UPI003B220317